jgi:LDH2 family malate/lactate/ureidoglycolate dehydrogenase
VSATAVRRYRVDDLRRYAAALGCASGLAPAQALALASHLLWFDAAGAASFGIGTLPNWLQTIETRQVDRNVAGAVTRERPGLAILDGQKGLAPLVLERAAEVAVEKARDTAVGLVRVKGIGRLGSAAPIVAAMAIRPMAGLVLGPGDLWSWALPSPDGLPYLFDSGLAESGADVPRTRARNRGPTHARASNRRARSEPALGARLLPEALDGVPGWRQLVVPDESWIVAAVSVAELEPLTAFHERLNHFIRGLSKSPGRLLPSAWRERHRQAYERGVTIAASDWKNLENWANRHAVAVPEPGVS